MKLSKIKWLNIILNVLVIVVLPSIGGILIYIYIEYIFAAIFIFPGIIAFFCEAMKDGADMK